MKIIKKSKFQNQSDVNRIEEERYILEIIDHPFITKLRFAFQTERKLYLVRDYYRGGDLLYHICELRRFSENIAKIYLSQIVAALQYLHMQNIIYRNLTPESISLDSNGYIRLSDFSLSKSKIDSNYNSTYSFCGVSEYIAPEIIERQKYGKCVDIWCLGILMYKMLYGYEPFQDENINQLYKKIVFNELKFDDNIKVSAVALDLMRRLLNKNYKTRITISDVEDHEFFGDIDFYDLVKKKIEMPIIPNSNENQYINPALLKEKAKDSRSNSFNILIKADFENFEYNYINSTNSHKPLNKIITLWDDF